MAEFADNLDRPEGWLFDKMTGPAVQAGGDMVPLFEEAVEATVEVEEKPDPIEERKEEIRATEAEEGTEDHGLTLSWPRRIEGETFMLSDGSEVNGRKSAQKAQAQLDAEEADGEEE